VGNAPLLFIWELMGSDFGAETSYPKTFNEFLQSIQANDRTIPQIWPQW
jgi:hypothetical protein